MYMEQETIWNIFGMLQFYPLNLALFFSIFCVY